MEIAPNIPQVPQEGTVPPVDIQPQVEQPQPVESQPVLPAQPAPVPAPKKSKAILIVVILGLIVLAITVGVGYWWVNYSKGLVDNPDNGGSSTNTPVDTSNGGTLTKPLMAPDFLDDQYWPYIRNEQITAQEAKTIANSSVGTAMRFVVMTDTSMFQHKTEHKGIPIMWTDTQAISDEKLEWLKAAIDAVPQQFLTRYPISGIYSGTAEEMKLDFGPVSVATMPNVIAFASGVNIFLADFYVHGPKSTLYVPPSKDLTLYVLIHEWTHVAQNYEQIYTFKSDYLAEGHVTSHITAMQKGFGRAAGWDYGDDPLGDFLLATLKTDADSQKTSDYGKNNNVEDMAETVAFFFTCQANKISNQRKEWVEDFFSVDYGNICE